MGAFETDANCIKQREYVNLPLWEKYTGKGITVFCDDVGGSHTACVKDIIQTILPEATVYSGNIGYAQSGSLVTDCRINCAELGVSLPFDDFITKYNVSLINNSTDGGDGDNILPIALYMKEKIKQHNLIFTGCAGNGGELFQKFNGACLMVTSCRLKDGVPVWSYMSEGESIDFAMFNGWQPGTSFSSPFLLGMAGKLRSKYPNMTQGEVKEYFRSHCQDILADGFDTKSGWGLPTMGNPTRTIRIGIGKGYMMVDDNLIKLEQPAMVDKVTNRTLVPMRAIAEALGCTVEWDQATQTVTIKG